MKSFFKLLYAIFFIANFTPNFLIGSEKKSQVERKTEVEPTDYQLLEKLVRVIRTKKGSESCYQLDAKQVAEMCASPAKYPDHAYALNTKNGLIALNAQATLLATFSDENQINIHDVLSKDILASFAVPSSSGKPKCLAFHPINSFWLAMGFLSGGVGAEKTFDGSKEPLLVMYNFQTNQCIPLPGHSDWVNGLCFSNDGSMLASISDDRSVLIWDVSNMQSPKIKFKINNAHDNYGCCVSFNADGTLLASGGYDGKVTLFDIKGKEILWSKKMNENASSAFGNIYYHFHDPAVVAFHPKDPSLLAVVATNNEVRLLDVHSENKIVKLCAPCDTSKFHALKSQVERYYQVPYITHIAFNPNGTKLAMRTHQGSLYAWNIDESESAVTMFKSVDYFTLHHQIYFLQDEMVFCGYRDFIKEPQCTNGFILRWNTNINQGLA